MTEPDYNRLAKAVRSRRTSLGLRQSDLGVSTARIGQVEQGKDAPLSALSAAAICRALGWSADSIDRVLGGGDPVVEDAGPTSFNVDERLSRLPKEKQASARAVVDAVLAAIEAENA
jgi:transcriptional regulator with XRE-family HTH domain